MTDDLTFTIAGAELPRPGEVTEHNLSEELVALIQHTGEPTEDLTEPTEAELDSR